MYVFRHRYHQYHDPIQVPTDAGDIIFYYFFSRCSFFWNFQLHYIENLILNFDSMLVSIRTDTEQ